VSAWLLHSANVVFPNLLAAGFRGHFKVGERDGMIKGEEKRYERERRGGSKRPEINFSLRP